MKDIQYTYIYMFSKHKTPYTCQNLQMRKEWNVNVNSEENGSQEVCLLLDLSHSHLGTKEKKRKHFMKIGLDRCYFRHDNIFSFKLNSVVI